MCAVAGEFHDGSIFGRPGADDVRLAVGECLGPAFQVLLHALGSVHDLAHGHVVSFESLACELRGGIEIPLVVRVVDATGNARVVLCWHAVLPVMKLLSPRRWAGP